MIFSSPKKQYDILTEQDSLRFVPLLFLILLPLSARLPHAHLCALCLVVAFLLFSRREDWCTQAFSRKNVKLYCLFLGYSLTGVFVFGAWRETLLSFFLRLSFLIPHLFPRTRARLPLAFSLAGGLFGALAVAELLLGGGKEGYVDPTRFSGLARAAGPFGNPNLLAAFLLPCALLALGGALFAHPRRRLLLACFSLAAAGVCATFSRGALLALLTGVLWLVLQGWGSERTLTGGLLLLPALSFLAPRTLVRRLSAANFSDSSVFYRLSLWKSVLRVPPSLLLFGVGEGKTAMLSLLSPYLAAGLSHVEHTHSLFLHLLVSGGLLGLLLLLCVILAALSARERNGERAALLALLIFGLFDDPLYSGQTEVIFWLVLGMC